MAGRGIEKARGDKRFLAVFGGASESGLKDLRWNLRLFPLFFALLLLCTHSWGSCTAGTWGTSYYPLNPPGFVHRQCYPAGQNCSTCTQLNTSGCGSWTQSYCASVREYCTVGEELKSQSQGNCPSSFYYSSTRTWLSDPYEVCGTYQGGSCTNNSTGCIYRLSCSNKCEADSAKFGGIIQECQYDIVEEKWYRWTCHGGNSCQGGYCQQEFYNDESLCIEKYCEENPAALDCRPACDTATLNNLSNHCTNDLEGTPNFRCNDLGNVVGYCDMCDRSGDPNDIYGGFTNPYVQGEIEARREQCCNGGGSIGDNSQFGCSASANGCYGDSCSWSGTNGGASVFTYPSCDLSKPVALGLTCEEYGYGNDSIPGPEESSSSADTSGTGLSSGTAPGDSTGDFEYDYNDSLHKIIDSLGKLISISQLMLEEMGTGGDTIIVNTERDSVINNVNVEVSAPNVYFNDSVYKTQLGNLENIQGRIKQILSPSDTTIQTSLYDTIALSFNKISAQFDSALLFGFRLDSVLFDENLVNVGDYGYQDTVEKYMGTRMAFGEYSDSIAHAWGADTISAGFDSSYAYGMCAPDDSACVNGMGDEVGLGDFLGGDTGIVDMLGDSLARNVQESEDSLPALWSEYWDSTKKYAPYTDFEERFMSAIGATIPNTNTCPENCSRFNIPFDGLGWMHSVLVDFKICQPISTFGGTNVLLFLRLILRILTIVSCLYITLWEVTTKRGKIGL